MKNYVKECKNKLNIVYFNRDSNLELLRIISMIMIIMQHYALYSGFEFTAQITINKIVVEIIKSFGKLGVAIFIIVSGYFYDKTTFKLKKLLNLMLKVWIYSILGLIIGILTTSNKLNTINIIKSLLPTTFGLYWFVSCYVLLYIFSPWIKKVMDRFERTEMKSCLILMFFIWSIIAIIPETKVFYTEYMSFILIYILGAYIKKYDVNILKTNRTRISMAIIIIIILIVLTITLMFLANKISFIKNKTQYLNQEKSPLIIILTILILNIFRTLKVKKNVIINLIATTTFGIYLIHENVFLRDIIWKNIVNANNYINSNLLIYNALFGIIVVFFGCIIIDLFVQKILQPVIFKIFKRIFNNVSKTKLFNNIKFKLDSLYKKL